MRPEHLVARRIRGSRVTVILLLVTAFVVVRLAGMVGLLALKKRVSSLTQARLHQGAHVFVVLVLAVLQLSDVSDGGNLRLRTGDFSSLGLFERLGTAQRVRAFQGAHLSDGGLDHTFRGLSLVDDLCGGVLADNGRRHEGRQLVNGSLGHSVCLVDSLDLSHGVYTRMSTVTGESGEGHQPTTVLLLVLTWVSVSLFTSVVSQMLV